MPKKPRKQEDESPLTPTPPPPYPIDEALEQAHQVTLTESDRGNTESQSDPGADWMDEPAIAERSEGTEPAQPSASEPERGQPSTEPVPAQRRSEPARASQPSTEQAGRPAEQSPSARAGGEPLMPQALAARLNSLAQWQAAFVLALMECGGCIGVAANKVRVSTRSVEHFRAKDADFDQACAEAIEYSNDLMEAAGFRGATVGDLAPVFQGGVLVGHKRQRSPKDLETMLKVRGRLKDEPKQLGPSHTMRVEIVSAAEVPQRVADTMKRLYAARGKQPVLDAETGRPVAQDPTRGV